MSGDADAIRDYLSGTALCRGRPGNWRSLPLLLSAGATTGSSGQSTPQKYNSFSVGPLFAYLLARENEIKTVRIILTGKLNELAGGVHPGKGKGDVCIRSQ